MSVHLLQLLLHHLLLLLLFISQCSDCSFFFISEKLMKLLKLLFNLTLCVFSLRLKSNHIHFNRLNQHTSTHHNIQLQEKLIHLTYNRPRSRSLLVTYNQGRLWTACLWGGGGGCWCPPPYRSRSGRIPLGRNRDCVPGRALHGPQM